MRRLLPDTIFGRTLLVLVLGLSLSYGLSMFFHYTDQEHARSLFGGHQRAERIAAAVRLIDRAPVAERPRLIEDLQSANLVILNLPERIEMRDPAQDWRADLTREALAGEAVAPPADLLAVDLIDLPFMEFLGNIITTGKTEWRQSDTTLLVQFRLSDGSWLAFASPAGETVQSVLIKSGLEFLIMAIGIVALSLWVARRLTSPIITFSNSAEALGRDIKAPFIEESGPREVRQAARAFNNMQQRIRRFIDDRTMMLASISHDLRTPITRLRLRAEFIKDKEERGKILANLREMEKMTQSTLSFLHDETSSEGKQPVDMTALVDSLCHDISDSGSDVIFRGAIPEPYICRPLGLRRALGNLIDNAVKYGKSVRVSLREDVHQIVIEVDVDGPGFPEDELVKVFTPFFRLDKSRGRNTTGHGLGLSVARTVLRGHGGDVKVRNREEGGLRATVTLPR